MSVNQSVSEILNLASTLLGEEIVWKLGNSQTRPHSIGYMRMQHGRCWVIVASEAPADWHFNIFAYGSAVPEVNACLTGRPRKFEPVYAQPNTGGWMVSLESDYVDIMFPLELTHLYCSLDDAEWRWLELKS